MPLGPSSNAVDEVEADLRFRAEPLLIGAFSSRTASSRATNSASTSRARNYRMSSSPRGDKRDIYRRVPRSFSTIRETTTMTTIQRLAPLASHSRGRA